MDIEIREFITYLHNRKRTSHNTEVSYQRDLKKMAAYFEERGIYDIRDVGELELEGYLSYMERGQFASSTISRNVASIRALFQYLQQEGRIERDPSLELKPPKVEKRMPEILSVDEVDRLLRQPDLNTPKGIRDSAMLELLYATGMRVSELLHIKAEHVQIGHLDLYSKGGKIRRLYIPKNLRTEAAKWLKEIGLTSGYIFLNRFGQRITTRGIASQLKHFAEKYGMNKEVVYPHSFRHRFAKNFLDRFNDLALLADLMGHESIETTRIYLRRTASEQQKIVDKVVNW